VAAARRPVHGVQKGSAQEQKAAFDSILTVSRRQSAFLRPAKDRKTVLETMTNGWSLDEIITIPGSERDRLFLRLRKSGTAGRGPDSVHQGADDVSPMLDLETGAPSRITIGQNCGVTT